MFDLSKNNKKEKISLHSKAFHITLFFFYLYLGFCKNRNEAYKTK